MALTDWHNLHNDFFARRRALVTGGAGFIGSHLTEALLDLEAEVVVLDDLSGGDEANLASFRESSGDRLSFIKGSITDRATLDRVVEGCDWVFHQAAMGSVPRSVREPERYHDVNATGTLNVLEASRAAGVKRVMFAASSSCYGDTPTLPKIETMPVSPRSPYAANKVYGEALMSAWANSYQDTGGPDTVCLRYFNIFGPRQNANSAYAAVIAAFASALLQGLHPTIFGDGEQSRDFTFVDNAVQANLLAARCENRLEGTSINVACGQRVTVNQLAMVMAGLLDSPELTPEHKPERAGDVKHSLAALEKAEQLLGYAPLIDFEAGLKPTVQWYREQHAAAKI